MPSIRDSSRLYSMEVDPEIRAARFRWKGQPTGEEFRYGANQLLEFVRSRTVTGLIVDTRKMTAHQRSSMEWLVRSWMPDVASAGIEHIAVVHGDDLIARTEMSALDDQFQQAESFPFFFATHSPRDAQEWVAEKDQNTLSFSHLARYFSSLKLFSFS
ncbi:hypothetical protein [Salinibacter altiplanensis]|uniref:hypothetical protein n=1 Tax=Salinibacter altiplanensis TaxID=1803181 RepID=UPI000C9F0EF9|nr:hypothetical protein [Salinibacter altiplanensis]